MRRFGTQGRVYPEDNYVVPRTAEVDDFINRRSLLQQEVGIWKSLLLEN